MGSNDQLLSLDELCNRLNIRRSVAYKLLRSQEIKAIQIGRAWRIPVSAVDAYLKKKLES